MTEDAAAPDASEEFVRLLAKNQRRIFLYVMTLLPNPAEAEEVVQETTLVLWREFPKFRPGSNFAAWACTVAFHQVMAWRKRRQRDRLEFSDAFLTAVADEAADSADALEERAAALHRCVEQLPGHQREMVRLRYAEERKIDDVAARLGRTVEAVYRALSRVRQALFECVTRRLAAEGPKT